MKILSPAGNFESLKQAIYNGADEVYLGINDFNARNNIDGFTIDNLKEAVDFSHIFNTKVLLAINILFTQEELQKALDIVIDAFNIGVDAFIIQDLALAYLINKNYPQIEIHSSTQMGIHNLEGVKALEKFGFKRVVLSRETPLSEIKRIKENSNIEIEYFCQGALCVCFSGNCYLSFYLHDASGNRGKCKQLCRLPFSLIKNGKVLKKGYLLSAKDFSLINRLKDLKEAGVDVLKIEGRARRPYYVGKTTLEYYKAINNLDFDIDNLKLAFNREYTEGYFNGNGSIISKYNNHIGIKIGKIEKVNLGKKFNEIIFTSNRKLSPKSTFKIFNNEIEKNTVSAFDLKEIKNGKYLFTTTQKIDINNDIHLILDFKNEEEFFKNTKKRKIELILTLEENKPIKAKVKIDNISFEVFGDILEKAIKSKVTIEELKQNFSKNEYFEPIITIENLDDVFILKQKLNAFRRDVFEKLIQKIINKYYRNLKKIKINIDYKVKKFEDFQYVEKVDEKFINFNIVYSPELYEINDIKNFMQKCENENKKPYLDLPNFALKEDILLLKNIIDETKINVVVNNYYALNFCDNYVVGSGLNVYNTLTAKIFDKPILCAESNVSTFLKAPYMTLRHCPMKSHLNANCKNCPYSKGYIYKMENGKELKLKRKKLTSCTFYLTD